MKKYNLSKIIQDAKDIYAAYKGRRNVKAWDGEVYESFTWGNALREAWAWAKEDTQKKERRPCISHAVKQAAIVQQLNALPMTRSQKQRVGSGRDAGFFIEWHSSDFRECCGQRRKAKPVKSGRSKEVVRRERLAHNPTTVYITA